MSEQWSTPWFCSTEHLNSKKVSNFFCKTIFFANQFFCKFCLFQGQSWKKICFNRIGKFYPPELEKSWFLTKTQKLSNFINPDFKLQFWWKLGYSHLKTRFLPIFPTLHLFFQLCSDLHVLHLPTQNIAQPFMVESWNFHRLYRFSW